MKNPRLNYKIHCCCDSLNIYGNSVSYSKRVLRRKGTEMQNVMYVRPGDDAMDPKLVYIGDKHRREEYSEDLHVHEFVRLSNPDYQSLSPLLHLNESTFVVIYESTSAPGFLAHTKEKVLDIEERMDAYMRANPRRPSNIDTILRGILGDYLFNTNLPAIRVPPWHDCGFRHAYVELVSTTKSAPDLYTYL